MHWLLFTIGMYASACYFGGLYLVAWVCLGTRPPGRVQRRLTRLLPGRSIARARLPRPIERAPVSSRALAAMHTA